MVVWSIPSPFLTNRSKTTLFSCNWFEPTPELGGSYSTISGEHGFNHHRVVPASG
jgi:hypothetical protein